MKMKNQDFFNLGLPKWPAFVVVGEPVTPEQAAEIILRTDSLYFSTNDQAWAEDLNSYLYDVEPCSSYRLTDAIQSKLGLADRDWEKVSRYENAVTVAVGKIPLNYLNNHQIASSWIGGAHGWCSWNGEIGCSNYNIGKWPSVGEVYDEWARIAKAFPFLELKCQLMNHEASDRDGVDDPGPVVEFRIKNGRVKMVKPEDYIEQPSFGGWGGMFGNERGCNFSQFKRAVDFCRAKFQ
jgi:hypothetical protein